VPADPSSLRFDRLAEDVEALREHLGEERVDLLGHSAGCIVAQAYARAHPDRLALAAARRRPSDRLQGGDRGGRRRRSARPARRALVRRGRRGAGRAGRRPPAQAQALTRATRPVLYGRWDERTQAHAATADRR
jgi:pimeloyl-ACP methyl ester carboxylesterase